MAVLPLGRHVLACAFVAAAQAACCSVLPRAHMHVMRAAAGTAAARGWPVAHHVALLQPQPMHAMLVDAIWVAQVDAIVYLVDAADRERFPESQRELAGLLSDDGLAGVPFLVLGNKIDLPYAGGCTDRPTVAAGSRASSPPQLAQLRWRAAAKIRLD